MPNTMDRATDSLSPIKRAQFGYPQAKHLLLRAGFGGSKEQITTLVEWGPEKAVDHLINFDEIPADPDGRDEFDHDIMRPLTRDERTQRRLARQRRDEETIDQFRKLRQSAQRADRKQMREIQKWWLTRMIQTPRPLEEKLTLFWHGHFATGYRTIEDSYHMYAQNRMFRANALGNFGQLLSNIIRDPAMLRYLNNNQNRKANPNENFAREIMELFSLGEGNYTENDIKGGARALTGYTYDDDAFTFDKRNHDQTIKSILAEQGNLDGDGFVNAILRSRACPAFICTKLYRFFVADIPLIPKEMPPVSRRYVSKMSNYLGAKRYELKPLMRKMLLSQHFYDPSVMNNKIKSPAELVVGAIRALNTPTRDITTLVEAMNKMGQALFAPPSVKGWDGGRAWISTATMFVRQNTMVYLLTGRLPTGFNPKGMMQQFNAVPLVRSLNDPSIDSPTRELIAADLLESILGVHDEQLSNHIAKASQKPKQAPDDPRTLTAMTTLITSLPQYQLC
ncbi:MAG: DUF1800 domain-containing protein [Phycisphaerales bacterium]|nr:DUF1800 domain-containing protein [Phycisphaerales bacterium]